MDVAEEGSNNQVKSEEKNHSVDVAIDKDSTDSLESETSWFTPKRLLLLFCVINLITYLDRGAIASTGVNGVPGSCTPNGVCSHGTGIQGDFNLNNAKDGILSSAFMVGLLLASPIFASLAKSINPFRLIAVGLSVWTSAAVGCGFSIGFWTITGCRMLVGVGEASFISLAAPFIDDNAPVSQRSAWLGIFYMCIPSGVALGYVYGGLVGDAVGWRQAFFGEAIMMVPFVILCFVMKPVELKGTIEQVGIMLLTNLLLSAWQFDGCRLSNFFRDVNVLLHEKIYVVNVLGYMAYNFVIGAYSYWGPKAGYSIYNMSDADMLFGAITIVGGIVGTLGGGFVLDHLNSTIPNAFKLLSAATFLGAVFCFSAFCFKDMNIFIVLFLIGEILVFATQGPVNFVSIHSVKPRLRPLSMAMSTVSIHIFGDVPSSPLVGIMQDKLKNWRKTALILSSVLFLAAGIWFIGVFLRAPDRYDEDDEDPEINTEKSNTTAKTTDASSEP
ncbi:probable sphingolipid transporter spinster homolog 2 [Cynara cardunculus var. scolymus]|uniref:probable sphingolipid transporter spinster homolog 2 n=1 Tax=Cynara cardunculus var. scolymus TaxID=59895 RepID=UPI000D625658|nr:probable sphingolipid transporter spinster homolog 2 [Cynara cardunculus var. scolymus]